MRRRALRQPHRGRSSSGSMERRTSSAATRTATNHLHGGFEGFSRRIWSIDAATVEPGGHCRWCPPDDEEGYPGTVTARCRYNSTRGRQNLAHRALGRPPMLRRSSIWRRTAISISTAPTASCVIGCKIPADTYLPTDSAGIPTGACSRSTARRSISASCVRCGRPGRAGAALRQHLCADALLGRTAPGRAPRKRRHRDGDLVDRAGHPVLRRHNDAHAAGPWRRHVPSLRRTLLGAAAPFRIRPTDKALPTARCVRAKTYRQTNEYRFEVA